MSRVAQIRHQATRLLALALSAREQGDLAFAEILTQRAVELLDVATEIEELATPRPNERPPIDQPPPAPAARSHDSVAQQQQQIQPADQAMASLRTRVSQNDDQSWYWELAAHDGEVLARGLSPSESAARDDADAAARAHPQDKPHAG